MTRKPHDAFVNGFNLYHSIDKLKISHLSWLELYELSRIYVPDEIEKVIPLLYFTAFALQSPRNYRGDIDQVLNAHEFISAKRVLH